MKFHRHWILSTLLAALSVTTAATAAAAEPAPLDLEQLYAQHEQYIGKAATERMLRNAYQSQIGSQLVWEQIGINYRDPFAIQEFKQRFEKQLQERLKPLGAPQPLPPLVSAQVKFKTDRSSYSFDNETLVIGPVFAHLKSAAIRPSGSGHRDWPFPIASCFRREISGKLEVFDFGEIGNFWGHISAEKLARMSIKADEAKELFKGQQTAELDGVAVYRVTKQPTPMGSTFCGSGGILFELSPVSFTIKGLPGGERVLTQFFWGRGA
ncbi:hypothetical protein LNV08_16120 [Paucibacter sp. TC2R-5]|uniref:hypothetical protein n=1 Tax=Paucibacter sp. TC2R-5 TaxID=2893555 RepID=UPI0021E40723|nr:hypothetical protein [Paucibacter sp. TC2R-5]MCV2360502.1 hypothetical protein [Paucibacter sp. TC2R-5]